MNIALEQTREVVDGVEKNNYGDAFIRGNNGKSLFPFAIPSCLALSHLSFVPSHLRVLEYAPMSKRGTLLTI